MRVSSKLLFLINLFFVIVLIFSNLYLFTNNIIPFFMVVINFCEIIAYVILIFYNFFTNKNFENTNILLDEAKLYNKTLSTLYDNVRCFKHDFSNIVQAIGGYIQSENTNGLKKYYFQLLKDCQNLNNMSSLNPDIINNPAIYNLLSSKYYKADSNGINFNINIFMDLNTLNIEIYEFTRILGILVDNAIEAASECEEKIINLFFRLDTSANRQLLIIENTYKDKSIDIEKIYEKSFSSKPNNTGLGLWEVRKILKRSKNLNLYTTKSDEFFTQQLEIYL